MGIRLFSECSCKQRCTCLDAPKISRQPAVPPNPDPLHYHILRTEEVGYYCVAEILYPDCTTHGGRKILVYEKMDDLTLRSATGLDPHFCEDPTCITPIARFEGTPRGWDFAVQFARLLWDREWSHR